MTEDAVKILERQHDKPFVLVASFLNPHNICEWARRLAGREQVLNCGEIGDPPPLDQWPPHRAISSSPSNFRSSNMICSSRVPLHRCPWLFPEDVDSGSDRASFFWCWGPFDDR